MFFDPDRLKFRHRAGDSEARAPAEPVQEAPAIIAKNAFPLAGASEGERLRVASVFPGKRMQHRLIELGLTVGVEVEVVRRGGDGPMLIGINDTRIALGNGMAAKIMVVPA